MDVNPYLMFTGRCEEALEFYQSAVGATDVHLIRFSEAPPNAGGSGQRPPPALSKGGQVRMPLAKTFWTSSFGMLSDKFGVGWMVSVEHK